MKINLSKPLWWKTKIGELNFENVCHFEENCSRNYKGNSIHANVQNGISINDCTKF